MGNGAILTALMPRTGLAPGPRSLARSASRGGILPTYRAMVAHASLLERVLDEVVDGVLEGGIRDVIGRAPPMLRGMVRDRMEEHARDEGDGKADDEDVGELHARLSLQGDGQPEPVRSQGDRRFDPIRRMSRWQTTRPGFAKLAQPRLATAALGAASHGACRGKGMLSQLRVPGRRDILRIPL